MADKTQTPTQTPLELVSSYIRDGVTGEDNEYYLEFIAASVAKSALAGGTGMVALNYIVGKTYDGDSLRRTRAHTLLAAVRTKSKQPAFDQIVARLSTFHYNGINMGLRQQNAARRR